MDLAWYVNDETGALFLLSEYQVIESRREPGASRLTFVQPYQEGVGAPEISNPAIEPDQPVEGAQEPAQDVLGGETEDETAEISAEIVDEDEARVAAQAQKRRGRPAAK